MHERKQTFPFFFASFAITIIVVLAAALILFSPPAKQSILTIDPAPDRELALYYNALSESRNYAEHLERLAPSFLGSGLVGGSQHIDASDPRIHVPENKAAAGPTMEAQPCANTETLVACYSKIAPPEMSSAVKSLFEAKYIYNRVEEMWRGEATSVVLKIAPSEMATTLSKTLPGTREKGQVPITRTLSADLKGSAGLQVTSSEGALRDFSLLAPTTWQWLVTPTADARRDNLLTLTIYAHFNKDAPYTVAVYEDTINIRVGAWQQATEAILGIQPAWAFIMAVVPGIWATRSYWRRLFGKRRTGFYNPPPPPV